MGGGRVGSGRVGSGRVGSGRVASHDNELAGQSSTVVPNACTGSLLIPTLHKC